MIYAQKIGQSSSNGDHECATNSRSDRKKNDCFYLALTDIYTRDIFQAASLLVITWPETNQWFYLANGG